MGVPRPISPEQRLVRGRGCPPPLTCSPGLIPIHHVGDGNMASGLGNGVTVAHLSIA
jgi:hypothetical protein